MNGFPKLQNTEQSQIELEAWMVSSGVEKYFESVESKIADGNADLMAPSLMLIKKMIMPLAAAIEASLEAMDHKVVHRQYLRHLDSKAISYITIKTVLNKLLTNGDAGLTELALLVGGKIHDYSYTKEIEEDLEDDLAYAKKGLKKKNARSYGYKLKVYKKVGRTHGKKYEIDKKLSLRVGTFLLGALERETGFTETKKITKYNFKRETTQYRVRITDEIIEIFNKINDKLSMLSMNYLPMVAKPLDWTNPFDGGYYTKEVGSSLVTKGNYKHLEQLKQRDLSEVYDALNAHQSVQYSVNKRVLAVVDELFKKKINIGALPNLLPEKALDQPEITKGLSKDEMNEEQMALFKEYKKYQTRWYTRENRRRGKLLSITMSYKLAKLFADVEFFHFSYNMCYRGRFHSKSSVFSPQGKDIDKGLLVGKESFSLPRRIDKEWYIIDGANRFGFDKVTFKERYNWVMENERYILGVYENPLSESSIEFWGNQAGSPFEFLAWCLEYGDFKKDPDNFRTQLLAGNDGKCNGTQITAALTRCEHLAAKVGLVNLPDNKIGDMYVDVVKLTDNKIKEIKEETESPFVKMMAEKVLEYGITRPLVKKPVMTMQYSVSYNQSAKYLEEYIDNAEDGNGNDFFNGYLSNSSELINRALWKGMKESEDFERMFELMDNLKKNASKITKNGHEIKWVLPNNFLAYWEYKEVDTVRVPCYLHSNIKLNVEIEGAGLDNKGASRSIMPNVMHSLDSALMQKVVNRLVDAGITTFSTVHDCYHVPARYITELRDILREEFFKLFYKKDYINELLAFNQSKMDGVELVPFTNYGEYDIRDMLGAVYPFG